LKESIRAMAAGLVSEYLRKLIAKQVADHRLVVWYDPDRAYTLAAEALDIPDATVARYGGSFLELRREVDPLLDGLQPPRLVVYVPVDQGQTHHALIELEAAGVVMQPGQQPPFRNTRLSVVARNALRPLLGDDTAAEVEKQVEAGKLSLADLDSLAGKGKEVSTGVLALVFGTANPQDVALALLSTDKHDAEIEKKEARPDLLTLLAGAYDIELPAEMTLPEARVRLARHVLLTDFVAGLGDSVPPPLASAKVASSPSGLDLCVTLARHWRLRRDVRDSYVAAAHKVENEFSIGALDLDPERLRGLETFLAGERALLRHVERSLLASPGEERLRLAESRLSRFWADAVPAVQARWALVATAAEVLLEADRVAKASKKAPATVPALVEEYAGGETPWCLLDTHHRHMESRWYNFEPEGGDDRGTLDKLVVKAEERYAEVGSQLAKQFVTQLARCKHPIKGLLRQRDIFDTQVKPRLDEGKVAYVWVDALRFEMARELARLLKDDFQLSVRPALGTAPTITEIGMAALLPGAGKSARVVPVGGGKLGLEIDGTVLKDRKDRVAFLKAHAGVPVFDAKLDDLLPKPSKRVREGVQGARLVLITSQEIDELCEADNIAQARLQMDGVLGHLRRGVRVLSDLGIETIILTADHGHLFADEIGDDMKIDAPGGQTEDLHRRVWVGIGGTSEPSYLRTPLAMLGTDSDLDIATPWTFACFKSKGGARAYFHGGLSPQELIVPVVVMTPTAEARSGPPTGIQWTLTPGSAKLSTRFFSVQIGGGQGQSSLFGLEPPKVRVEVRANKKVISSPVSASYGFEDATGEVKLKAAEGDPKRIEPNTVTVMITDEPGQKTVGIYLIDANSGAELKGLDKVENAISM
jgi:hypothetical protein